MLQLSPNAVWLIAMLQPDNTGAEIILSVWHLILHQPQQPRFFPFSSLPSTRSAPARSALVSATNPAGVRLFLRNPAQLVALFDWHPATLKSKPAKIIIR